MHLKTGSSFTQFLVTVTLVFLPNFDFGLVRGAKEGFGDEKTEGHVKKYDSQYSAGH